MDLIVGRRISVSASPHSSFLFVSVTCFVFLTRYSSLAFCVLSFICIRLWRRNYPTPCRKSRCRSSSSTSPSPRMVIVSPELQSSYFFILFTFQSFFCFILVLIKTLFYCCYYRCWSSLVAKP